MLLCARLVKVVHGALPVSAVMAAVAAVVVLSQWMPKPPRASLLSVGLVTPSVGVSAGVLRWCLGAVLRWCWFAVFLGVPDAIH